MKLQLDFDNKTIKVESKVEMKEFIDILESLKIDWKNWYLETSTVINNWWTYPIYTIPYSYTEQYPKITWSENTTSAGIINISTASKTSGS